MISARRFLPLGWIAAIAALAAFPERARSTSCVVGPFIAFFDLSGEEIGGPAPAVLDIAATQIQICGIGGRIMIAGHADRSGSQATNMSLSKRRAERVRAYLAGRGLSDWPTTVAAFGESLPLVETPDGVQEGLNRRVEITVGPGEGE